MCRIRGCDAAEMQSTPKVAGMVHCEPCKLLHARVCVCWIGIRISSILLAL